MRAVTFVRTFGHWVNSSAGILADRVTKPMKQGTKRKCFENSLLMINVAHSIIFVPIAPQLIKELYVTYSQIREGKIFVLEVSAVIL